MNVRPRKATRLTASLDAADVEALNRIAEQQDVSLSWVIRQAIRQFANSKTATKRTSRERTDAGPST